MPTDGELYRFDTNHPDTNGMIEYFVRPMGGTRSAFGRSEVEEFAAMQTMGFRAKPAAVLGAPGTAPCSSFTAFNSSSHPLTDH